MIRIVLAEDHHVVRAGLRALLAGEAGLAVVGEASDGLDVVGVVERTGANVLVLDISLPGLGGFEVLARSRRRCPATRVVVLTMYDDEAYVAGALRGGASAFVLKCSPAGELVQAIRAAARGERFLAAPISTRSVEEWMERTSESRWDVVEILTPREREALHLAAEGLSNPEIALRLGIAVRTAEQHRANLLRKLTLRNQSELVRFALEHGIALRGPGIHGS